MHDSLTDVTLAFILLPLHRFIALSKCPPFRISFPSNFFFSNNALKYTYALTYCLSLESVTTEAE